MGELLKETEENISENIEVDYLIDIVDKNMIELKNIRSISIGVPGSVNNGRIYMIDGYEKLQGCELREIIEKRFLTPTTVFNNMNAIAFGLSMKEKEQLNIACIHFGLKGPCCGCVVNGKPLMGFCGFNGEVAFIPFDKNKSFRDLLNNESDDLDYEEYIGKIIICIITIINPSKIYLYLEQKCDYEKVEQYCKSFLPQVVFPKIIISLDYMEDYAFGLKKAGIDLVYENLGTEEENIDG